MKPRPNTSRDERGVAMLYVAVFLLSSFWLVSLALDMGKLMVTKTELQKAADAAALAGASAIDPVTGKLVKDEARDRAYETALRNTALQDVARSVVIDKNTDVEFPVSTPERVTVRVHRTAERGNAMTTIFARALGISSLDVRAVATAEVAPIDPCENAVPLAAPEINGGYKTVCGKTYELSWAAQSGVSNSGSNPEKEIAYVLDLPSCDQGQCETTPTCYCYTRWGYSCCLRVGDKHDTEPGYRMLSLGSSVRSALRDRWFSDTDKDESHDCYSKYAGNGNRVLIVPIIKVESNSNQWAQHVPIVAFGSFFITRQPRSGDTSVTGQFIASIGSGDPIASNNPNKVYGTRLVQ